MSAYVPQTERIPPQIHSVVDYESWASELVEDGAWAYLSGGAADEQTLRQNREVFGKIRLCPRVLPDGEGASTGIEMLGRKWAHPIMIAPMASHRLFHPQGELATVLGAAAMQAGMVVSMQASTRIEDVSASANGTPLWFQLYLQGDLAFVETLVRRVEAVGYEALVVTVDAPVNGVRNREQRAGFRLPEGAAPVNLKGMKPLPVTESPLDSSFLATLPTWQTLRWLKSITDLPVFVKGTLSPADAGLAIEVGMDGVIVSNHGGRTLDTVITAMEALPAIVERVAGRIPVLCDGGIRRGTDVLKALALGADAVLIGRPILHALAVAGAPGVAHVLKILRTELEAAMLLSGCPSISSITPEVIWRG
jgi:4-hydroxymandelate oxidase